VYGNWIDSSQFSVIGDQYDKNSVISEGQIVNDKIPGPPELPCLALVVSGGHTELLWIDENHQFKWLGGTRDDAAGECLDKGAKILGLPYPGGPNIAKLADEYRKNNKTKRLFPRPMLDDLNYDWSFSGLKNALRQEIVPYSTLPYSKKQELAAELEEAVVGSLVRKLERAIKELKPKSLIVGGGVSANSLLRSELMEKIEKNGVKVYFPELKYCTDNAAMVGACAYYCYLPQEIGKIKADPGWELDNI
jgi:N6-L-threonylcarbamoyladenine synthase